MKPWEKIHRELGLTVPDPVTTPLGRRIAEIARQAPDAKALFFEGLRLTYGELARDADRLASSLASEGIGAGDVIALYLPNVPQFVVGVVAASRLGAVACGVSTLCSARELGAQLTDSRARALIALDTLAVSRLAELASWPQTLEVVVTTGVRDYLGASTTPPAQLRARCVATFADMLGRDSADFEGPDPGPDEIFLLQYTGGTTGRSKGAMLSKVAVMTAPLAANSFDPYVWLGERMVSAFPLFHIGGLMGLIGALSAGGEYLLALDPRDLYAFVRDITTLRPTRLGAVPTFYQMLLRHPGFADVDLSALKVAVTGGAPITGADRERLDARLGAGKLADVFGMTETCATYVSNPPSRPKPAALGIPLPGVDVRIVDLASCETALGPGETGEIITANPFLMQSYCGMPEETAKALRPLDDKLWMYTGDVGHLDEDGYLYISDRAKDMLIVGGFKVFSLEVQDVLRRLDFVAAAAVVGTPDHARPGNDIVLGFIQLTPAAQALDSGELRARAVAHCRQELAPYKVLKQFAFVDALPATAVGKVDKNALRALGANLINGR